MKTIEVFCGTKSFSKVAIKFNYNVLTLDNNKLHDPDVLCDYLMFKIPLFYNVYWFSPPCTAFSVASMGKHWDKETKRPKTETAHIGLRLLDKTIHDISKVLQFNNKAIWFIENPMGFMRKKIDDIFKKYDITDYERKEVTYCQYGDKRMKPTDIWTNLKSWNPKPKCKNGMPCHESSPRGSKTGTQGLKNDIERGKIPEQLFYEIFEVINNAKTTTS